MTAPFSLSRDSAGRPITNDPGEPVVARTQTAALVGVDVETKIVKTEKVDIKPFADYSRLLSSGTLEASDGARTVNGGGGFTAGMLGRFNAGSTEKVHAFRVVLEGRYFDSSYIPGYFDTFYEIQKYQFITGPASVNYRPKLYQVLAQDGGGKRTGFYVEGAYQYNGGFAVMTAFEMATTPDGVTGVGGKNFTFHVEYPAYSFLQFFGSFYRRNFTGALFPQKDSNDHYPDDMLIYAAARLHILPILFLNARYYRTWQADPVLGQMRNINGAEIDLEFGYEFDRRRGRR